MAHFKIDYTMTLALEEEADNKIDANCAARIHQQQLEEALCEISGHEVDVSYKITPMPDVIDVYFEDLTPEKQQELLAYAEVAAPSEMNWDIFPIATIEM